MNEKARQINEVDCEVSKSVIQKVVRHVPKIEIEKMLMLKS